MMAKRTKLADRKLPDYTRGEEIFNMSSHIVGGAMGVVALVLCVVFGAIRGKGCGALGGAIFGSSMIILYTMSSIYHGLSPRLKAKKVFQVIDHCAIFVLIAGTYTPITLCSIRAYDPVLGWWMFGLIWGVSILGITLKAIDLKRYEVFSMICYLGLGWCVILTLGALREIFPMSALILLFGGGVAYTIGAILYGLGKKKRYAHSIFHLFVLVGSFMHMMFILLYVV